MTALWKITKFIWHLNKDRIVASTEVIVHLGRSEAAKSDDLATKLFQGARVEAVLEDPRHVWISSHISQRLILSRMTT